VEARGQGQRTIGGKDLVQGKCIEGNGPLRDASRHGERLPLRRARQHHRPRLRKLRNGRAREEEVPQRTGMNHERAQRAHVKRKYIPPTIAATSTMPTTMSTAVLLAAAPPPR
jgi:hypothetical protein